MDQHTQLLLQVAEARRMHGARDRLGTVHDVWRKDGEQKVRLNVGIRPDGTPWLTPWLKVESPHGALRKQHKWHKGQNVKLSSVGSDFSQATVTPYGENDDHKEPDHADDVNETEQYAKFRKRTGPDFQEHWLAKEDSGGSGGSSTQSHRLGSAPSGGSASDTDPDLSGVVVVRMGAKPQADVNAGKGRPWDGPSPKGGSPKKQHMTYAGEAGKAPKLGDKEVIHQQFGDKTSTSHTDGQIQHMVQSIAGDLANAVIHMLNSQQILGAVGGNSWHQILGSSINSETISHFINSTATSWLHSNGVSHIHGGPILTNQMILHPSHSPPGKQSGKLEAEHYHEHLLGDSAYAGDAFYIANGASFTASYSSPTPPSADNQVTGPPFNGFRWIDTASSIEYVYYDGVWAEGGGGGTSFPISPAVNQLYTYNSKQWTWNGTGWQYAVPHLFSMSSDGTTVKVGSNYEVDGDLSVDGSVIVSGSVAVDVAGGIRFPPYSAADIDSLHSAVNTASKAAGKAVWDVTNHRIMVANGSSPHDTWYSAADPAVSVTPGSLASSHAVSTTLRANATVV